MYTFKSNVIPWTGTIAKYNSIWFHRRCKIHFSLCNLILCIVTLSFQGHYLEWQCLVYSGINLEFDILYINVGIRLWSMNDFPSCYAYNVITNLIKTNVICKRTKCCLRQFESFHNNSVLNLFKIVSHIIYLFIYL